MKNKKIFVTGGAGFIASHIIERLVEENDITIYDNLKRNAYKYSSLVNKGNVKLIEGDVLDFEKLCKSMSGSDVCIHAAAIAGIYSVGNSLTTTMKVNLLGTYNALESAKINSISRFMDFSTSEIYGPFVYRGNEEQPASVGPASEKRWIYAVSKLAAEHFAHAYSVDYGMNVTTVRPFNVYGPRQVGEGAIQQMTTRALNNEDIVVYNDGTQIRSWCYVDDFADAFILAIDNEGAYGEIFNFGNPQSTTTILSLAESVLRITNSKSKIIFKPHPGPEVEMRVPDISKAHRILGFTPKVGFEEGLIRAIDWYKENR